jgi:hypothetical protein
VGEREHPRQGTAGEVLPRDTVAGVDGQRYTSDQATIWRWRKAFQNDFAARTPRLTAYRRVVLNLEPARR